MSEDLYKDIIIREGDSPQNFYVMSDPDFMRELQNPLCGDIVTVYLMIEDNTVKEVSFDGYGCKICMASASVMTRQIKTLGIKEIAALTDQMQKFISETQEPENLSPEWAALGKVREFPSRKTCVLLPWNCLSELINPMLKDSESENS